MNETSSRSACWSMIRSSGSSPASLCSFIQRRRSSLEGSPKKWLRYWLRDRHMGTGLIHENRGPAAGTTLASLQRHPAPASELREDPGAEPVGPPDVCFSPVDNVGLLTRKAVA